MIAKARLRKSSRACLLCRCLFLAHQCGNARGRRNIQEDLRQIRIAWLYLDEQKDTEKCHQRHKGENSTKINGIFLAAQTGTGAHKRETYSKEKYDAIQMYRVLIYVHADQTVPCHTGAIDKAERESQTGRDPKIASIRDNNACGESKIRSCTTCFSVSNACASTSGAVST